MRSLIAYLIVGTALLLVAGWGSNALAGGTSAAGPDSCSVSLVPGSAIRPSPGQIAADISVTGASGCLGYVQVSTWTQQGSQLAYQSSVTSGYGVGTFTLVATVPTCAYQVVLTNPPSGANTTSQTGPVLGQTQGGSGACPAQAAAASPSPAAPTASPGTIPDTGGHFNLAWVFASAAASFAGAAFLAVRIARKRPARP